MATPAVVPPNADFEDVEAQAGSGHQQQQQQQQGSTPAFIQQSSHPVVVIFHLLFRSLAVLTYLFLSLFTSSFVLVFVLTIILLAFDFWTVKNVSGRLLVGLRWWNQVNEDGSSQWIYESRDPKITANPSDARVFWWSLYIFPVIWGILGLVCILTLSPTWLLLVAVAMTLNVANIVGYRRCYKNAKAKAAALRQGGGDISDGGISAMAGNAFGKVLGDSIMQRAKSMF